MRHIGYTAILVVLTSYGVFAADQNGYTAKYECRAGGPQCDVDVASLTQQACQQIITPSTPWSSINWSNNTICIEAGDHTSKGTLTIKASGNASARKVLRCVTASGAQCTDPWDTTAGNRAVVRSLDMNGHDYWIIDRLTADPNFASVAGVRVRSGSNDVIINRTLVQRTGSSAVVIEGSNNTLQNSVVRTTKVPIDSPFHEYQCTATVGINNRIVNNELYDCNKGVHVGAWTDVSGFIVENNDVYLSSAGRTDCNGNFNPNGNCGVMELLIGLKSGGTSGNPVRIFQNRLWGVKYSDGTLVQAGDAVALSLSASGGSSGTDYVLVQNNILVDNDVGIWNYFGGPNNNSIIGNIVYDVHGNSTAGGGELGWCFRYRGLDEGAGNTDNWEFYLNTCIAATDAWFSGSEGVNHDIRCNVAIASGAGEGADGSGVQKDYNVYYGTGHFNETNRISHALSTRANSTSYSLNAIIRTSASPKIACTQGTEEACFLYRVIQAGTTASSKPAYPTILGGTVMDGSVQLQAVRGPYTFRRKLRTVAGGEPVTIPYTLVHSSASEARACASDYAARRGIGINDQQ